VVGEAGGFAVARRALYLDMREVGIEDVVVGERANELAIAATGAFVEIDQDFGVVVVKVWHG
jgi:hypothetical protein